MDRFNGTFEEYIKLPRRIRKQNLPPKKSSNIFSRDNIYRENYETDFLMSIIKNNPQCLIYSNEDDYYADEELFEELFGDLDDIYGALKNNSDRNYGKLWTYVDKIKLCDAVVNNITVHEICNLLGRSETAIRAQVNKKIKKNLDQKTRLNNKDILSDVVELNIEKLKKYSKKKQNMAKDLLTHIKNNISKGICTLSSRKANQWIESIMDEENIYIQYAKNDGEYIIPGTNYSVDGYCEETNTIYEFNGCYYHGCLKCNKYNMNDINEKTKKSYMDLYKNTIKKEAMIKKMGYNLEIMWECVYDTGVILTMPYNEYLENCPFCGIAECNCGSGY